ncbi:hypothetical protein [Ornithinimicrobium faecis]|uniref:hypothetical protein n=1 Tax=Ornithinimicrobium faecis TaxID=2934158 RepID=UPI0021197992|nr:hypothetical protein [Ornithinimicrobium sp. HY1745]
MKFGGELVLLEGGDPLFTGHTLDGVYETYWSRFNVGITLAIITPGAQAIGAVAVDVPNDGQGRKDVGFVVTTGPALEQAQECFPLADENGYRRFELSDALICQLGPDIYSATIDVLVGQDHQPCGYVFSGEYDFNFEERVLPDETERISIREFREALLSASDEGRLEVISAKGQPLGDLTGFVAGAAWEGWVNGTEQGYSVRDCWESGVPEHPLGATDPEAQIGLRVHDSTTEDFSWVRLVEVVDGNVRLHLGDARQLPDSEL